MCEGFRDTTGSYLTNQGRSGVWLSDTSFDANEGAKGEDLLAVELPNEIFTRYEWVEELKGYREALIPAEIVNGYPVKAVSEEEEDAL